jgi:spermidine/putrescine transport system ATP-binding protein
MQIELKRLQERLKMTFVFVTHDQEEALTMSDRIAVINKGRIEQLGDASEIYHQPRTTFVANFIGQANILDAQVISRNAGTAKVRLSDGTELTINTQNLTLEARTALISIRPEKFHLERKPSEGNNVFPAVVQDELFKGAMDELSLQTQGGLELTAVVANESIIEEAFHKGDTVYCHIHPDDIAVVHEE